MKVKITSVLSVSAVQSQVPFICGSHKPLQRSVCLVDGSYYIGVSTSYF